MSSSPAHVGFLLLKHQLSQLVIYLVKFSGTCIFFRRFMHIFPVVGMIWTGLCRSWTWRWTIWTLRRFPTMTTGTPRLSTGYGNRYIMWQTSHRLPWQHHMVIAVMAFDICNLLTNPVLAGATLTNLLSGIKKRLSYSGIVQCHCVWIVTQNWFSGSGPWPLVHLLRFLGDVHWLHLGCVCDFLNL